ncbi:MAG: thioredoxin family protein [Melioribacteraceae bacterium]|nr:thioredoxin family protein [Melioribacteraceae bacterium]
MSAAESSMIPLGTQAPYFNLPDTVSENQVSLNELQSEVATVIMFICNHCPYVININNQLVKLANYFIHHGIKFAAISSNDIKNYPQDSPEKMKEHSAKSGYPFPYLYDETQEVAKAYKAECTPDFFVFDKDLKCVYRGQFDDSRPNNGVTPTGKDLHKALKNILDGKKVDENQIPSIGCNIKWKK